MLNAAALVGLGTLLAAVFILAVPGLSTRYFLDEANLRIGWKALALLVLPAVMGAILIVVQALYFPGSSLTRSEYAIALLVGLVLCPPV